MVDFIVFPFLVSSDFSVGLLQQEVKRTGFFPFTEAVCLIDVDLSAQNP